MSPLSSPAVLADLGPSVGFSHYLLLGMVATVNPCGFAMLPAYLSYFLGLEDGHGGEKAHPLQALRVALAVSAGFMAVFAVAATAVRLTSLPVYQYAPWISVVIGTGLVALGLAMVGGFELVVNLPKLTRGGRERTVRSMFVFGMSYAVCSIGCTLPLFIPAVVGTMRRESYLDGLTVFVTYGVGMAAVLTALTMALALARTSLVTALRSSRRYVNRVAGGLVALAGAYVAYFGVEELRTYDADRPEDIPDSPIIDRVQDWSYTVQERIEQIGPVRLLLMLGLLTTALALLITSVTGSRLGRKAETTTPSNRGVREAADDRAG